MSIPIGGPVVFLRCRKCGRRTDHAMIDSEANKKGEIEEIYECQECGEVKRIYEFAALYVYGVKQPSVTNMNGPQKKRRFFKLVRASSYHVSEKDSLRNQKANSDELLD